MGLLFCFLSARASVCGACGYPVTSKMEHFSFSTFVARYNIYDGDQEQDGETSALAYPSIEQETSPCYFSFSSYRVFRTETVASCYTVGGPALQSDELPWSAPKFKLPVQVVLCLFIRPNSRKSPLVNCFRTFLTHCSCRSTFLDMKLASLKSHVFSYPMR